jgi:hypothetical protein
VTYYNQLNEAIPEPAFEPDTDLELHAPVGAYALCTVTVCASLVLVFIRTQANEDTRCDVLYEHILPVNMSLPNRGSIK